MLHKSTVSLMNRIGEVKKQKKIKDDGIDHVLQM
jgi:hypothetical protein